MIRPFRRRHRRDHEEIHPPPTLSLVEQTADTPTPNLAAVGPSGPSAQGADPRQLDKQFLAMLIAFADADRIREAPPIDSDGAVPA